TLVAAKSSASHLCIDGALNPPGCLDASLDSKFPRPKCSTGKNISRKGAKTQRRKGRFDCLLCAFAGITLFVHWFAHGVEDIDLAPRERAPVEVDDQRVESH